MRAVETLKVAREQGPLHTLSSASHRTRPRQTRARDANVQGSALSLCENGLNFWTRVVDSSGCRSRPAIFHTREDGTHIVVTEMKDWEFSDFCEVDDVKINWLLFGGELTVEVVGVGKTKWPGQLPLKSVHTLAEAQEKVKEMVLEIVEQMLRKPERFQPAE